MSTKLDSRDLLLSVKVPKRTGRKRLRGSSEPFTYHGSEAQLEEPADVSTEVVLQRLGDRPDACKIEVIGTVGATHRFRSKHYNNTGQLKC